MSKENGGPAFPVYTPDMNVGDDAGPGMSLRDWFAGQAITAAAESSPVALLAVSKKRGLSIQQVVAGAAYEIADAMLEARKASEPTP